MKNNLKEMRLRAGLSQVELAEKLNSTQGMIGLLERGERKLAPEWLKKLSQVLSCSPLDILPDLNTITPAVQPNQNTINIEMLNASACCGDGTENFTENVIGYWQMPKEEYRAISTIAPEHIKMLRVYGDSMEKRYRTATGFLSTFRAISLTATVFFSFACQRDLPSNAFREHWEQRS